MDQVQAETLPEASKAGTDVRLGLGLIGIGRSWGYRSKPLAGMAEVEALLRRALALGVRLLDTAASYGSSEALLGQVLRGLGQAALDGVTIATKFGDHWDAARGRHPVFWRQRQGYRQRRGRPRR